MNWLPFEEVQGTALAVAAPRGSTPSPASPLKLRATLPDGEGLGSWQRRIAVVYLSERGCHDLGGDPGRASP